MRLILYLGINLSECTVQVHIHMPVVLTALIHAGMNHIFLNCGILLLVVCSFPVGGCIGLVMHSRGETNADTQEV